MQHLKLLGGIATHKVQDSLDAAGVLLEPVAEVHHDTLDNDPHALLGVVLGDLLHSEFLLRDLERLGVVGLGCLGTVLLDGSRAGSSRSLLGDCRGCTGAGGSSTASAPRDCDLVGDRRVKVQGDLANTLSGAGTALESLSEEVVAGSVTSDTAVHDTAEKRGTTQTVGTVDTTSQLTTGVETLEGLLVLVQDLSLVVDLDTTHGEVQNGLHDGNVEVVIDVERQVVEELLAPGVLLLAIGNGVVGLEGLLEVVRGAANLLSELLAGHLLHKATARVVASVEVKDLGGLGVENKSDGELVLVLLLPHLARDVVTVAELITESVTIGVQEQTTLTTEGLSGKELPLGARVLGVNETSGVDLDLVHVDTVTANGHDHLLTVTSSVCAVGGGKAIGIGAVLLEQGGIGEIGSVTTGSKDDGAVNGDDLAIMLVLDTSDVVALLVQLGDTGLLDNLDTLGLVLGKLLEALHQGVCNGHTGKLGIVSSVGSGLGVTTVTSQIRLL